MRVAWAMLLLILCSHAVAVSNRISADVVRTKVELTALNTIGAKTAGGILLGYLVQAVVLCVVASRVMTHAPKQIFPKEAADHPMSQLSKRSEHWIIAAVLLCLTVLMWAFYLSVLVPEKIEGDDYNEAYRKLPILAMIGITIMFACVAVVVWEDLESRTTGFILSLFLTIGFISVVWHQALIAGMIGEWKPYVDGSGHVDATVSTSMDNLVGLTIALFGMAWLAGLITIAESFIYESDDLTTFYTGHVLRVSLGAMCTVGMVLVASSPLKFSPMNEGHIKEADRDRWNEWHFKIAGITFVALFSYIAAITWDHCHGTRKCTVSWWWLLLASLAVVSLGALMVAPDTMTTQSAFAIAEYVLLFTLPLAHLSRFTNKDVEHITQALILTEKHRPHYFD